MAEFIRKKRFIKYHDAKCKKFLSRDFHQKCAYCKIREGDLGGPDDFEKDHFKPIAKGGNDHYENLYYACSSCNGKSGKSDTWSQTLLDPCKDDIFDVHIKLNSDYSYMGLTSQGQEYIKTLRLNRKNYVERRRILDKHKTELNIRLQEYKKLYAKACLEGVITNQELFERDMSEIETVLKYGVNYRLSENYFDKKLDEFIFVSLSKIGKVKCVDRDFDLFYELEVNSKKYLCYIEIDNLIFKPGKNVRRYISAEKIVVWREIAKKIPIVIITFNTNNQNLYYTKFEDILEKDTIDNPERCAYYIQETDLVKYI